MRASPTSSFSLALLLVGCAPPGADDATPETCDSSGETLVGAVSTLVWGRADDSGVSRGFDLDGRVSTTNDNLGCGIEDYVSPEGEPGIDNGFTRLLPTLELTEFMAVEGLVAQNIASGNLLITLEISGVDDRESDDCVDVTLGRGTGDVLLGTDGMLESGQTIERDTDLPAVSWSGLAIEDGRIVAQGFDWALPLQVFQVSLDLALTNASMSVELDPEGGFSGVFGGGASTAYIMSVASEENVDDDLVGIMAALLEMYSDLEPDSDGVCQQISTNFEYKAIPAFFFEDEEG